MQPEIVHNTWLQSWKLIYFTGEIVLDIHTGRKWYKTALLWICGIDREVKSHHTDQSEAKNFAQHLSLEEKRIWWIINNVLAGVLVCIGTALFIYWA